MSRRGRRAWPKALPYVVLCLRTDGSERAFQRYADRAEAELVAAALRRVQCPARVADPDELQLTEDVSCPSAR